MGRVMERRPKDRLMTVKQLAAYLNVNERTVLKLVYEGALPGVKVGNQWRFRLAMIDTWLDDQMLGVMPRYLDPPEPGSAPRKLLELSHCFQPDHIVPELEAKTKTTVIEELAAHAHHLGGRSASASTLKIASASGADSTASRAALWASMCESLCSHGRWSASYFRPSTKKRWVRLPSRASKSTPSVERPSTRLEPEAAKRSIAPGQAGRG
jgi:excisionase family DNA binding protein